MAEAIPGGWHVATGTARRSVLVAGADGEALYAALGWRAPARVPAWCDTEPGDERGYDVGDDW